MPKTLIQTDLDILRFERFLTAFAQKQVPFAIAMALTRTARDTHRSVRVRMRQHFKIRNERVVRGIQFKMATKRDPVAEVGSLDDFMVIQELGGIKKPRRSRRLAIPSKWIRRSKTGRIAAAKRPRRLLARKDVFEASRRGGRAIYQRTKGGLKLLFNLSPSARMTKRLGLFKTAREVARARLHLNFAAAMAFALRTAKNRPGKR